MVHLLFTLFQCIGLDKNGDITRTDLLERGARDGLGYFKSRRQKGDNSVFLLDYGAPAELMKVITKHHPNFVRKTSPSTGFLAGKI